MTDLMVDDIRDKAIEVMTECKRVVFTTIDGSGFPQSRVMESAGLDDDFTTYFITERTMDKTRQVYANPRISAYWVCPDSWRNVHIKGTAVITEDGGLKERLWRDDLAEYFPEGISDRRFVVMVVKPFMVEYADEVDGKSQNLI